MSPASYRAAPPRVGSASLPTLVVAGQIRPATTAATMGRRTVTPPSLARRRCPAPRRGAARPRRRDAQLLLGRQGSRDVLLQPGLRLAVPGEVTLRQGRLAVGDRLVGVRERLLKLRRRVAGPRGGRRRRRGAGRPRRRGCRGRCAPGPLAAGPRLARGALLGRARPRLEHLVERALQGAREAHLVAEGHEDALQLRE